MFAYEGIATPAPTTEPPARKMSRALELCVYIYIYIYIYILGLMTQAFPRAAAGEKRARYPLGEVPVQPAPR